MTRFHFSFSSTGGVTGWLSQVYKCPNLDEIIAQQGKGPITDLSVLHGDFWPEDESIEEFLAALHEWRGHTKRVDPAA